MLIYSNTKLGEEQFKFILLSIVSKGNQQVTLNFKDILQSTQRSKVLADLGDSIEIVSTDGFDNVIPIPAGRTAINFSSIINQLFDKCGKEVRPSNDYLKKLADSINVSLKKANVNITLGITEMNKLLDSIVLFKNYIEGKDKFQLDISEYDIPLEYREQTTKIITNINSKFDELSFLDSSDNVTLFMETPEDEVSLKIPSLDIIKSGINIALDKSEYFSPFGNTTEKISEPFSDYEKLLPAGYNLSDVVGSPANSDLPIQPNEEKFYSRLCKLIDYGINHEDYKNSIDEYLESIIVKVATWNWNFTGRYPTGLSEEDLDEYGNAKESDDKNSRSESNVEYPVPKGMLISVGAEYSADIIIQGDLRLLEYIRYSEKSEDAKYAKAEAIIKLLRWGNRKPNKLHIANSPRYLDLKTYTLSSFSGDYKNLKPITDSRGVRYTNLTLIRYDDPIKDTLYAKSQGYTDKMLNTVVGVRCTEHYEGNIHRNIYMSIFDFINILQDNPKAFNGIELVNDEITYTGSLDSDTLESNTLKLKDVKATLDYDVEGLNYPYFSKEALDFYSTFMDKSKIGKDEFILNTLAQNIGDSNLTTLFEEFSFKSIKELGDKVSMKNSYINLSYNDSEAVILNTVRELGINKYLTITELGKVLPLIYKANAKIKELKSVGTVISFNDLYREYAKVMIIEGYNVNMLNKDNNNNSATKNLKKLNITNSAVNENNKDNKEIDLSLFIREMPKNKDNYYPIVKKVKSPSGKAELSVIGTLCIEPNGENKEYIITSEKYTNVSNKPLNITKILKIIFKDYINILNGNSKSTSIRFTSKEDMIKLFKEV